MAWHAKYGASLEFFLQRVEEGHPPSPALLSRPTLSSYLTEIYNGFSFLSGRRQMTGMGPPGLIPLGEIVTYVDHVVQIDDEEDRLEFIQLIDYLDRLYLEDVHEKCKAENNKNKQPKGGR